MGHDVNVHKHFYRLQDRTLELAKVSKLLLAIDEGKAGALMGKRLDDIGLEGRMFECYFGIISISTKGII